MHNVGAVVGDHMCTHCSSFLSNDRYNSHWLGERGEILRFSEWFLSLIKLCDALLGANMTLFFVIPFIQAKKATDRVYNSITTESLISWRTWFLFCFLIVLVEDISFNVIRLHSYIWGGM
jgi:hypothetical protein